MFKAKIKDTRTTPFILLYKMHDGQAIKRT